MPITQNLYILLFNFYFFSLVGMVIFGGKNQQNSKIFSQNESIPQNYYLLNFNDLISSYITLLSLMVVNNWMVIVDLYVLLMGN